MMLWHCSPMKEWKLGRLLELPLPAAPGQPKHVGFQSEPFATYTHPTATATSCYCPTGLSSNSANCSNDPPWSNFQHSHPAHDVKVQHPWRRRGQSSSSGGPGPGRCPCPVRLRTLRGTTSVASRDWLYGLPMACLSNAIYFASPALGYVGHLPPKARTKRKRTRTYGGWL